MPKRKNKDDHDSDSEEPVTKKRDKAETKKSTPVEKPEQKEDDQGLPYWEVYQHLQCLERAIADITSCSYLVNDA